MHVMFDDDIWIHFIWIYYNIYCLHCLHNYIDMYVCMYDYVYTCCVFFKLVADLVMLVAMAP